MKITCLLHQKHLPAFRAWLAAKPHLDVRDATGTGDGHCVLRVRSRNGDWGGAELGVYKRARATEHLTVDPRLAAAVRSFLHLDRQRRRAERRAAERASAEVALPAAAPADLDLWALWPDDFMCPLGEVEEHLQPPCARSDDYARVEVLAYDETGTPAEWRRAP